MGDIMKEINGIKIPETISEARQMNYEDLKKACEVFNSTGISAEELQKQWNKQLDEKFLEGFDAAIALVYATLNAQDKELAYTMYDVIYFIEEEVDLYLQNG